MSITCRKEVWVWLLAHVADWKQMDRKPTKFLRESCSQRNPLIIWAGNNLWISYLYSKEWAEWAIRKVYSSTPCHRIAKPGAMEYKGQGNSLERRLRFKWRTFLALHNAYSRIPELLCRNNCYISPPSCPFSAQAFMSFFLSLSYIHIYIYI